jgi:hypothetical protein
MYRANQGHLQTPLFSDLDHLSEKARQRLEESWAGVFYREFFCRLDERPFAVLYSDVASRPNTPINVLVGLEMLKAALGWSDQEMHDAFLFDLQVRYALGYRNLGEGEFELRTVYNFRQRVNDHMGETGENLIEGAFEQVTDEQVADFQLQTGSLRMDSTQIASNIRQSCRLRLLVEILQRTYRMLSEDDQAKYAEAFAPYLKGSSGQYVYHLKGQETEPHLQRIGELMHQLLVELAPTYPTHPTYQMLQRVFDEQFDLMEQPSPAQSESDDSTPGSPTEPAEAAMLSSESTSAQSEADDFETSLRCRIQAKPGQAISPNSLRSPDDPEATYRKKGHKAYQGYVTNVTETCDPNNPLQLMVKVQTAPNTTEDTALLLEALPNLTERTQVDTLYNDAGFCGPDVDDALRRAGVRQIPSALPGRAPDPRYTHLSDFEFHFDNQDQLIQMTCPHDHTLSVERAPAYGRYVAAWADAVCPNCRFRKSQSQSSLRFSQAELDVALRRQRCIAYRQSKPRLRAAVEATVGAIKRPFNNDKTPVRGRFRVNVMMMGSAAMVNIRRIERYLLQQAKVKRQAMEATRSIEPDANSSAASFLSALWACCQQWLSPASMPRAVLILGF